jgi:hypothetical protein
MVVFGEPRWQVGHGQNAFDRNDVDRRPTISSVCGERCERCRRRRCAGGKGAGPLPTKRMEAHRGALDVLDVLVEM